MKEIKAYLQRAHVNEVVAMLEKAGAPGVTVVSVRAVGYGYESDYFERQFEHAPRKYQGSTMMKLETVCADQDVDTLVQIIREETYAGDGMIFVSNIQGSFRIRDGVSNCQGP